MVCSCSKAPSRFCIGSESSSYVGNDGSKLKNIGKAAVASMRDAGLARNVAVAARDMYKTAAATGIMGRDVAVARLKLMNEILKKW